MTPFEKWLIGCAIFAVGLFLVVVLDLLGVV